MALKKSIKQHWHNTKTAFVELRKCVPVRRHDLPNEIRGKGSVYVFFGPGGTVWYVGRGRDLSGRILQHSRTSTKDAPFAWLLARWKTKRFTDYSQANSRNALLRDKSFVAALEEAKEKIGRMKVAWVVVEDDTTQCLVEIYAAVALDARFNSLRTT
jgi:hypothetical protein